MGVAYMTLNMVITQLIRGQKETADCSDEFCYTVDGIAYAFDPGHVRKYDQVGDDRLPAEKRLIFDVFKAAGTAQQADVFRFALPIVGIDNWSKMLPKPGPFPDTRESQTSSPRK